MGTPRFRFSTPCVGKTGCARLAVAVHQPLNLTPGKIQLRGHITATQTFFNNSLNGSSLFYMVTSISRDLPEKAVNAPHLGDIMNQLKSGIIKLDSQN